MWQERPVRMDPHTLPQHCSFDSHRPLAPPPCLICPAPMAARKSAPYLDRSDMHGISIKPMLTALTMGSYGRSEHAHGSIPLQSRYGNTAVACLLSPCRFGGCKRNAPKQCMHGSFSKSHNLLPFRRLQSEVETFGSSSHPHNRAALDPTKVIIFNIYNL